VLGIAALLFVSLLVLGKLYDRAQGNSQFRRRLLGASLTLLALCRLGYQVLERRNEVTLLRRVDPVYPPLAKQARIQGKVRFDAVINSSGEVEKLTLITAARRHEPRGSAAYKLRNSSKIACRYCPLNRRQSQTSSRAMPRHTRNGIGSTRTLCIPEPSQRCLSMAHRADGGAVVMVKTKRC